MSALQHSTAPKGSVRLRVVENRELPTGIPSLRELATWALPRRGLGREVNTWRIKNLPNLWRGLRRVWAAQLFGIQAVVGMLYLEKTLASGEKQQYGLASMRVVTTAGVNYIVDSLQDSTTYPLDVFKYHGVGSSSATEAVGDTGLTSEFTTEYATDNTRPTGTQTENGTNVYETVASFDPDSSVTVREHGIFTQAATGGGTLLDRTVVSDIAVAASGETLTCTYDFTVTAGS